MLRTNDKNVKKEAIEVFKHILFVIFVAFVEDSAILSSIQYFENHIQYNILKIVFNTIF